MSSPTSRTLQWLRKHGYVAGVVERWNPYAKVRHDLFGFIDIVAIASDAIVGVQATSGANHAARVAKIRAEPNFAKWRAAGGRAQVISWSKKGARGKRKTWAVRIEDVA